MGSEDSLPKHTQNSILRHTPKTYTTHTPKQTHHCTLLSDPCSKPLHMHTQREKPEMPPSPLARLRQAESPRAQSIPWRPTSLEKQQSLSRYHLKKSASKARLSLISHPASCFVKRPYAHSAFRKVALHPAARWLTTKTTLLWYPS